NRARDQAMQLSQAAERRVAELRQSLQKEYDRAETLVGELARARRDLETQLALSSKADNATVRVKKAAENATPELRQPLKKEREQAEASAPGRESTLAQVAEVAATEQPAVAEAHGSPEAARLMTLARALLVQGDIGAARIVLEHAVGT